MLSRPHRIKDDDETPASTARHSLDRSGTEYDPAVARRLRFNPRAVIAGTVFATIIGLAIWYLARLEPLLVRGEVESTRIDIAARVSGRLVQVPVSRGQDVAAGTTLLVIDNPELVVQLHEAEAGKLVADAELARINVGTRSEIIAQRKAEIDRAAADLTLAQQTFNRTKQLAAAKFAPQSKLDQDTSLVDLSDSWLGFSLRCDRGAG
jgi:HlyD family secretion protein